VGRTLTVISHSGAPGAVVGQQPSPEETVAPETAVDLLVAAPGSGEIYVMPDVVYRDYAEVRRFFERRGFRLGNIRFESYDGVAEGVILRQYPLAGHPVSRRDAIALVVATAETTP
jgi:beta-lactam-binding protein with PASTA domain